MSGGLIEALLHQPVFVHRLFAHPEWLGPIVLLCLGAVASVATARRVAGRRRARLGARLRAPGRHASSDLLLLGALVAIGLALAGPRLGERTLRVPGGGVDVVFLMDVSRSMDARDVPPSRLARAREALVALLERLEPADRAALAVFAGRGVLMTPLTPDREALAELASALDTDLIHPASSDLAAGLRASLDAFAEGSERPRAIFVLADGEDPQGGSDLALGELVRAGVRVSVAAFGTEAGSTIPDHGAELRDARGTLVITRRRATRLETLAEATQGGAWRSDSWGRIDVDAAAAAIRREAGEAGGEPVLRRVRAVQVAPLAALAFALLLADGVPRHRLRSLRAPSGALALLVGGAALIGAGPAEAPADARVLVELGVARMQQGEPEAAARALTGAAITARDPRLAALAYYDLGVNALEGGDLAAARDAFFDALALAPGDREARFNLEWTLRALATEPPSAPEPPRAPEPPPERERPRSEPEPEDERAAPEEETQPADAPTLPSEEQRRRWLERAQDDPGRSLRLTAGEPGRRRPAGPVW